MKLHKEHGLNPTIAKCIICHKDKNEIALLGAAYKDEAPMHMIVDIEPCEECKKNYLSKGVLLVEAKKEVYGYGEKERIIPTGKILVIKDEAYQRIFNNSDLPTKKIVFTEPGIIDHLMRMSGVK